MNIFPKAIIKRILKENGANRVSEDAIKAMNNKLTNYANTIGTQSIEFAKHAGRETIYPEDVELAQI